jgi:hypothetical protein
MQHIAENANKFQRLWLLTPHFRLTNLMVFAGDQLQDKSRQWLSSVDPSTNFNSARKAHHDGTAAWFIQDTTFHEWEVNGSLLWIHGKRMFISTFSFFSLS